MMVSSIKMGRRTYGEDQEPSFGPKMPFRHLLNEAQPGKQTTLSIAAEGIECMGLAAQVRVEADKREDREAVQGLEPELETDAAPLGQRDKALVGSPDPRAGVTGSEVGGRSECQGWR